MSLRRARHTHGNLNFFEVVTSQFQRLGVVLRFNSEIFKALLNFLIFKAEAYTQKQRVPQFFDLEIIF